MNLYGGLTGRDKGHVAPASSSHCVTRDCLEASVAGLEHTPVAPHLTPLLDALQRRVNADGAKLKADMLSAIGRWSGE
jgi:hypothetical protein